jgi:hypothetical protein
VSKNGAAAKTCGGLEGFEDLTYPDVIDRVQKPNSKLEVEDAEANTKASVDRNNLNFRVGSPIIRRSEVRNTMPPVRPRVGGIT